MPLFEPYKDRDRDSGVRAFACDVGEIHVQFKDGWIYVYDQSRCGAQAIAEMVRLARSGDGLNAYINRNVRRLFTRKYRQ